ncbi:MAG: hypothetical protein MI867_17570 [Pseudomonadales bacterium]|nr:hypothetical protein [Pseudomonadales bacterium]
MTMLAHYSNEDVQYNSKYFNENNINRLLNLKVPDIKFDDRKPVRQTVAPLTTTQERNLTDTAVAEAIEWMQQDEEYAAEISKLNLKELQSDISSSLTQSFTQRTIQKDIVEQNRIAMSSIRTQTDENGIYQVNIGDEQLFRVNTKSTKGGALKKILAAAFVLLDVIAIISDVIGIGLKVENTIAEKVSKWLNKISDTILGWGKAMWRSLKSVLPEMKAAKNSSKWLSTISKFAKRIGNAIFAGLSWAWEHRRELGRMKDAFIYGFKAMFAGSAMKCVYYAGKMIASIIVAAASAGASLYIMILELTLDLASFVEDTIEFVNVMSAKNTNMSMAA